LHVVGYLYYWQMGFNSVFKGLIPITKDSLPSSAAVMEEQSYNSIHPLGHTGPVTGTLYL